jgi:hypothetical protein
VVFRRRNQTRFITCNLLMLASRLADNDAGASRCGRRGEQCLGPVWAAAPDSNAGRCGGAVFPVRGHDFGYYGLAWSIYSSVIARGGEVQFDKNAVMDIKFGTRAPSPD